MVNIPTRSQLRMICTSGTTDANGYIELDLKIPGDPMQGEQRVLEGGQGWFDNHSHGDIFKGVYVIDIDNLVLGKTMAENGLTAEQALAAIQNDYPDYPIMGQFHEKSVTPPAQSGWFFYHTNPVDVKSIGGSEDVPSGFYLRFMAQKASAIVDNFRVNIFWGKP